MSRFLANSIELLKQPSLSGLLGSTFALGTAFSFVVPFLSTWGTEEIGLTPTAFSGFMVLTSLSAILVSTYLARLSDTRFSRKAMLIAGSLGGTIGFLGYAFIRDPLVLLCFACTFQALAAICFAQLFSHVREFYRPKASNPAISSLTLSVVRVVFSFSWTTGPALGALVLLHFNFEGLFVAAASLYFLFLIGCLLFVPRRAPAPSKRIEQTEGPTLAQTLRRPEILAVFSAFAVINAANAINAMNLPLAVTRTLGGNESDFGIIFGIGPVVEIPLMLWFGHLASKGHQQVLIRLGMFTTLAYFVSLYFCEAPWHVYLAQILSGVSFAILTNVAILFFQDLIPDQLGLSTSLFSNAGAVGNIGGLVSFGFLVESMGHRNTFLACATLAAIAVLLFMAYRVIDYAKPRQ